MSGSSTSSTSEVSTALTTAVIAIPAREPPPTHLVVMLHGVGADAAGFQDLGRVLSPGLPRAEFVVPDGFHDFDGGGSGRQWFSIRGVTEENRAARVREAGEEVSRWIDAELARRNLTGDRLVVVGFSQGAIVGAWLALHRSPRPAAVVMLSGRVAEDQPAPASTEPGTPVMIAHGDRDPVISVDVVEPSASILTAWGARVTKRVYPGLAHQVDARELREVGEFLATALAKP